MSTDTPWFDADAPPAPPKPRGARWPLVVIGGFLLLVLVVIGFAVWDHVTHNGETLSNVRLDGREAGGLDEAEVDATVQARGDEVGSTPVTVRIGEDAFTVTWAELGVAIDADETRADLLKAGRSGFFLANAAGSFTRLGSPEDVESLWHADTSRLDAIAEDWRLQIAQLPVEGHVAWSDEEDDFVAVPPADGVTPNVEELGTLVTEAAEQGEFPAELTVGTVPDPSPTQVAVIEAAVAEARSIVAEDVVLEALDGTRLVVQGEHLGPLTHVDVSAGDTYSVTIDREALATLVAQLGAPYSQPGTGLRVEVLPACQYGTVTPGESPGRAVDTEAAVDEVLRLTSVAGQREGRLSFGAYGSPESAAASLRALMMAEFTTMHPAGENRVINIQRAADILDGHIVPAGEIFSLNGVLGERTAEDGFVPAGTIVNGELVSTVGGGLSQFATTMYNAIFFSGLEDIEHKPHSAYFSRYPEGHEATVNWNDVDLKWRNDTEFPAVIDTEHTDDSITVRICGDNGGRTVEVEVSERYNHTGAITVYRDDPSMPAGAERVIQEGFGGFSVDVIRTIMYGDGRQESQDWHVVYIGEFHIIARGTGGVPPADTTGGVPPPDTTGGVPPPDTTAPPPPDTTQPPPPDTTPTPPPSG